jgi:hypothetical protein
MTFVGKTLVFLNLVAAIGAAVWATALYTNRPSYFVDIKESSIDKGNAPRTFPQMTAEIDARTRAANLAAANWGAQVKALQAAEAIRSDRHARMFGTYPDGTRPAGVKGLIDYAHEGGMPDANGGGFLNLVEDPATRLLDLSPSLKDAASFKKVVVHGPDDQPLKGTDTLLDQFTKDAAEAEVQAFLSKKLRGELSLLGTRIVLVQSQVLKQREIRDNLNNEAAYLANFEINATLNKETYETRQRQLLERLRPLRETNKK